MSVGQEALVPGPVVRQGQGQGKDGPGEREANGRGEESSEKARELEKAGKDRSVRS